MEITELKISGMTCGSCAASVSNALKRIPGVKDVQVDLLAGMARITGEHVAQNVPTFIAALSKAGYAASENRITSFKDDGSSASCHSPSPTGAGKGRGCCCR